MITYIRSLHVGDWRLLLREGSSERGCAQAVNLLCDLQQLLLRGLLQRDEQPAAAALPGHHPAVVAAAHRQLHVTT